MRISTSQRIQIEPQQQSKVFFYSMILKKITMHNMNQDNASFVDLIRPAELETLG